MKKKYWLLLVCAMVMMSGCRKEKEKEPQSGKFYECQKGFVSALGNDMYETPEGFYFMAGYYLMFVDEQFEKPVIVCDKAECLHNRENPENKASCNAFFWDSHAFSYYNGKIYVLAQNMNKSEKVGVNSIYEVSPDGSEKEEIYSSGDGMSTFCIHRGNAYVYEKKYIDEEGNVSANPVLTITKFPVDNPKKAEVLFETDEYPDGEINGLTCYKDYCYFRIITDTNDKKINLKTGEVTDCPEGLVYFGIGKDRMYAVKTIEQDVANQTWKSAYFECGLDGEIKEELTTEKFSILDKNPIALYADDEYIYFSDVDYGGNEVPEAERKLYVCTYDGESVCEIPFPGLTTIWGNDKYLFYCDTVERTDGESDTIYYYVDKAKFGEGAKFEVMFNTNGEDYLGAVWTTH